jgi:hypothetical protein
MASPNATFTELVTTTFRKHRKEFRDNVSNNNALLAVLDQKGMKRYEDGGLSIVEPLDYAQNTTYQRYSGYDTLNINPSDVLSGAEYTWRQIAIHVTASGEELRKNSGGSQIIKLAKSRLTNAMRSFKNNFSADIYGDGTLPNQIGGLQLLVADAGTGTVGGINSSTFPFWQNRFQSAAAPMQGGAVITPSGLAGIMESLMLPLWMALVRGDDKPNLIIADNNYFSFYELGQNTKRLYTSDGSGGNADAGFLKLRYKSSDVIFDGGSGIPANHMYFLNTDYLKLVVHQDADMEVLDEMRPVNQDSAITPILWMGNLTCSNRFLQGVVKA